MRALFSIRLPLFLSLFHWPKFREHRQEQSGTADEIGSRLGDEYAIRREKERMRQIGLQSLLNCGKFDCMMQPILHFVRRNQIHE